MGIPVLHLHCTALPTDLMYPQMTKLVEDAVASSGESRGCTRIPPFRREMTSIAAESVST